MSDKVEAYLSAQKQAQKSSEVAEEFFELEQTYVKRLWNQLGGKTEKLVYDANFTKSVNLEEFYSNFIFEFEHRIGALQLVRIILPVARFIFKQDPQKAFDFLAKFTKSTAKNAEASVRLATVQIELRLAHKDANGAVADLPGVRKMIEDTQVKVDALASISAVHAAFYKVSATYLREVADYSGYYREALRYLGCESLDTLTPEEQRQHAVLLGFAALLGKDLYNFGELLAHPVLETLKNSTDNWLYEFLQAFNAGNLQVFYDYEKKWINSPDMAKNRDLLETKVRLLCLMEIASTRASRQRQIPFAEIAEKTRLHIDKVEFLVMKALSNGLIRGRIDQVHQHVNVTWIQPRVLSIAQINAAADRINEWRAKVTATEELVTRDAKEIIVKN